MVKGSTLHSYFRMQRSTQMRIVMLGMLLVLGIGLLWLFPRGGYRGSLPLQTMFSVPQSEQNTYATNFAVAESAISEGRKWVNGKTDGLDWNNVATTPGLAYGTEPGTEINGKAYDDSTTLLTGAWGPNQTAEATVHSTNQGNVVFEEVELRLRSTLSAHYSTGYEVLFRCLKSPEAYASIVRWDGAEGNFTYLSQKHGLNYGVSEGDVVKAVVVGNVITAYINNVPVLQATDSRYTSGNPGIGFWFQRSSGIRSWLRSRTASDADYGFTRFAAWD